MFRPANHSDIPFITDLLEEFYSKQGHIYGIAFDRASTVRTVRRVIDTGICLVGPRSVAGGVIRPSHYNEAARVAMVTFWYFTRAREIRIIEAFRNACAEAGATHLSAISHPPDHRIARYYKKWLAMTEVEGVSIVKLT